MMGWQWHQLDQTTTPVPHHSVSTHQMPFLLPTNNVKALKGKAFVVAA